MDVTSISNGDYIKVKNVDFGTGATSFDARVASNTSGGMRASPVDSRAICETTSAMMTIS